MNVLKHVLLSGSFLLALSSCNQQPAKTQESTATEQSEKAILLVDGTYVSDGYDQRAQGNDWVGVTVKGEQDSSIAIQVRSRADQKKPTCTLDAKATLVKEAVYRASLQGKNVLFTFNESSLTIATENPADEGALHYYCSGGGTVADTYKKNAEALDATQVDTTKTIGN